MDIAATRDTWRATITTTLDPSITTSTTTPTSTIPQLRRTTPIPKPTDIVTINTSSVALPAALSILGAMMLFFMVFTTRCRTRAQLRNLRERSAGIQSVSVNVPFGSGRDPNVDAPPSYDDVIKDTSYSIFPRSIDTQGSTTEAQPSGPPPPTYLDSLSAEITDVGSSSTINMEDPIPGTSTGCSMHTPSQNIIITGITNDAIEADDSVFYDNTNQASNNRAQVGEQLVTGCSNVCQNRENDNSEQDTSGGDNLCTVNEPIREPDTSRCRGDDEAGGTNTDVPTARSEDTDTHL